VRDIARADSNARNLLRAGTEGHSKAMATTNNDAFGPKGMERNALRAGEEITWNVGRRIGMRGAMSAGVARHTSESQRSSALKPVRKKSKLLTNGLFLAMHYTRVWFDCHIGSKQRPC